MSDLDLWLHEGRIGIANTAGPEGEKREKIVPRMIQEIMEQAKMLSEMGERLEQSLGYGLRERPVGGDKGDKGEKPRESLGCIYGDALADIQGHLSRLQELLSDVLGRLEV